MTTTMSPVRLKIKERARRIKRTHSHNPLPKILLHYLDGLDACVDGRGWNDTHQQAMLYVVDCIRYGTIRRDALLRIVRYPKSDCIGCQMMQALAAAALKETA